MFSFFYSLWLISWLTQNGVSITWAATNYMVSPLFEGEPIICINLESLRMRMCLLLGIKSLLNMFYGYTFSKYLLNMLNHF